MAIIYVLILVLVEHTLRDIHNYESTRTKCLNPCFSGTYSQSCSRDCIVSHNDVLILVLVEHTLREKKLDMVQEKQDCLNPCFSGTYSQRHRRLCLHWLCVVLILVLVEHTLREQLLQQTLFQCITRRKTEHSAISCGNYVPFSMQRYEIFQRTKALYRANFTPKLYNATLQSDYSVGI